MNSHKVILSGRGTVEITGVTGVVGFDDESIIVDTEKGRLQVQGSDITIQKLSVETGEVTATGDFAGINYIATAKDKGGFIARLFK